MTTVLIRPKRLSMRGDPRRSFPFNMEDPEKAASWMEGLDRWLRDHPIDYDHLDRYMGTHHARP